MLPVYLYREAPIISAAELAKVVGAGSVVGADGVDGVGVVAATG